MYDEPESLPNQSQAEPSRQLSQAKRGEVKEQQQGGGGGYVVV